MTTGNLAYLFEAKGKLQTRRQQEYLESFLLGWLTSECSTETFQRGVDSALESAKKIEATNDKRDI